jgi:hypothetical protein
MMVPLHVSLSLANLPPVEQFRHRTHAHPSTPAPSKGSAGSITDDKDEHDNRIFPQKQAQICRR